MQRSFAPRGTPHWDDVRLFLALCRARTVGSAAAALGVDASPEVARELGTLHAWSDAPWVGWGERSSTLGPARWLETFARGVDPVVRSDHLRVQISVLSSGVGVGLVPEPSVEHYGLVPVKLAPSLRESAAQWPSDELFLITHRALRDVPRVRVLWDLLVERLAERPPPRKKTPLPPPSRAGRA